MVELMVDYVIIRCIGQPRIELVIPTWTMKNGHGINTRLITNALKAPTCGIIEETIIWLKNHGYTSTTLYRDTRGKTHGVRITAITPSGYIELIMEPTKAVATIKSATHGWAMEEKLIGNPIEEAIKIAKDLGLKELITIIERNTNRN